MTTTQGTYTATIPATGEAVQFHTLRGLARQLGGTELHAEHDDAFRPGVIRLMVVSGSNPQRVHGRVVISRETMEQIERDNPTTRAKTIRLTLVTETMEPGGDWQLMSDEAIEVDAAAELRHEIVDLAHQAAWLTTWYTLPALMRVSLRDAQGTTVARTHLDSEDLVEAGARVSQ